MKFTLFNIGKTDIPYLLEGINEYESRIRHFIDFTVVDVPGIKVTAKMSADSVKKKEGTKLIKELSKQDYIVLLDERGSEMSSRKFADWLDKLKTQSFRKVAFVSGGAFGFSDEIYSLAQQKLALSKMTYTHQMVRLVFTEQLYRACTILKGMKYHND
jgi:23S rRNA (pseudouridine1915-N3)-methyltransferase